jgi:hypothetical protein
MYKMSHDTNEKIELIMRQTNYDRSTAEQKLAEHNNDTMIVIRDYLNPQKTNKICSTKFSVNQQIYKEIRGMMDDAAKTYLESKK